MDTKKNETFTNRALDNIMKLTGERPTDEANLKDILYRNIQGPTFKETDLLYEAMEAIVGWHFAQMNNTTP
jgi:hypothetical protein